MRPYGKSKRSQTKGRNGEREKPSMIYIHKRDVIIFMRYAGCWHNVVHVTGVDAAAWVLNPGYYAPGDGLVSESTRD
jgi:hypothetical protein